jgi:hypothetical protein
MTLIAQEPQKLSWVEALDRYHYPVDLRTFVDKAAFGQEWFVVNIATGDRSETIQFENHFRQHAASQLPPWYQVIFWKMASQGGRADVQTRKAIDRIAEEKVSANDLWSCCAAYVASGTKEDFCRFQKLLFKTESIAIAFTFPALCCPARIPMIDTRIARYVASEGSRCGFPSTPDVEKTLRRYRPNGSGAVLSTRDWPFVEAWVGWCRKVAGQLSNNGDIAWRARDVEMAVFRAWGEAKERNGWPKHQPRFRLSFNGTVS